MKKIIITQARTGSTRFPNKVMQKTLDGKYLIDLHLDRLKSVSMIDDLIVATTINSKDDLLASHLENNGHNIFRGEEKDVLSRFYHCAMRENASVIVRLTSDCPLIDPKLIDSLITKFIESNVDYLTNCLNDSFPDGQDIEIFKFSALERAFKYAKKDYQREHVTPYIRENKDLFEILGHESDINYNHVRLTVDVPKDLMVINKLISELGTSADWIDYTEAYLSRELDKLNGSEIRNEGFLKSKEDER